MRAGAAGLAGRSACSCDSGAVSESSANSGGRMSAVLGGGACIGSVSGVGVAAGEAVAAVTGVRVFRSSASVRVGLGVAVGDACNAGALRLGVVVDVAFGVVCIAKAGDDRPDPGNVSMKLDARSARSIRKGRQRVARWGAMGNGTGSSVDA
jgi:hypothetical protein